MYLIKRLLKIKTLGLFLLLFTSMASQLDAQSDYVLYPSWCYYQGVNYHIGQQDDWNFYDCNPTQIVKWKYYNGDCELVSVTYGPDSQDCLCGDGTLQLTIMPSDCDQMTCQEINEDF